MNFTQLAVDVTVRLCYSFIKELEEYLRKVFALKGNIAGVHQINKMKSKRKHYIYDILLGKAVKSESKLVRLLARSLFVLARSIKTLFS